MQVMILLAIPLFLFAWNQYDLATAAVLSGIYVVFCLLAPEAK